MSESDLYSNYIRREPHERSKKFISNWHNKLLKHALSDIEDPVKNVLEIGPDMDTLRPMSTTWE